LENKRNFSINNLKEPINGSSLFGNLFSYYTPMKNFVNPIQITSDIEPRSLFKMSYSSPFSRRLQISQSLPKDPIIARPKSPDGIDSSKIIVILGPNASGKSELAVKIAEKFNGEIISADSRQVYQCLNIGAGKVEGRWRKKFKNQNSKCETAKENAKCFVYKNIPHYCIDFVSPKKIYTAAEYKQCAQKAINNILSRGKLPIMCGGTGFYIESALGKIQIPEVAPDWKMRKKLERKSAEQLFKMLQKLNPARAKKIDAKNKRRLIRAIEINSFKNQTSDSVKKVSRFFPLFIGVAQPPKILKKRIKKRLLERIDQGMIKEVENLRKKLLGWKRLDDLGLEYRWIAKFLQRKLKIEKSKKLSAIKKKQEINSAKNEFITKLETEIWRYAKRQISWFRRLDRNLKKENSKICWIKTSREAEKLIKQFLN
jgi:tRNA dimethylallyltransferase